ncbi:MAG: hypothetical protein AB7F67_04020 [Rhodospirillaceae bacterium]
MPDDARRTIPQVSVDTNLVFQRLETAEVGEVVTYAELTVLIGRDVTTRARHNLTSAVRRAERERGMIFAPQRGVGVKRLSDAEIVEAIGAVPAALGRRARRAARWLAAVADWDALPPALKARHNAYLSALGALTEITRPATIAKLERHVDQRHRQALPVAKTLDAFKA